MVRHRTLARLVRLLAATALAGVLTPGSPSTAEVARAATPGAVAAEEHTCVSKPDGTVWCWGRNEGGQVGNGTVSEAPVFVPAQVSGISGAVGVATGTWHSCAVLANGTVKCWGGNSSGQLGNGTATSSTTPVGVVGIDTAVAIAAGSFHTCALLDDGSARCWGSGSSGALGDGSGATAYSPVAVAGVATARAINARGRTSCVVLTDGTLRCWGLNAGSVPVPVVELDGISTVAVGGEHLCVTLADGGARCWGQNDRGQLGDGTLTASAVPVAVSGISSAVAIAAGEFFTCALLAAGTVRCWGRGHTGELGAGPMAYSTLPVEVSGVTGAAALGVGIFHACVLLRDGGGRCWGANAQGELGAGPGGDSPTPIAVGGLPAATALSAADAYACAILADTTVRCWGSTWGGLGDGSSDRSSVPVQVVGITGAAAVAAGENRTCVLIDAGTVRCWGISGLGNGSNAASPVPVLVSDVESARHLAAGPDHVCVVLQDGGVRCWGQNTYGQLGNGTLLDWPPQVTAEPVAGVSDAVAVAAGVGHTCALLDDGRVTCWGNGDATPAIVPDLVAVAIQGANAIQADGTVVPIFGEYRNPVAGVSGATGLAAGPDHACAVLGDGSIICWGSNEDGQLGTGTTASWLDPVAVPGISTAAAVATGSVHTCALLADGTVRCWGRNWYAQLGDGRTPHAPYPVPVAFDPPAADTVGPGTGLACTPTPGRTNATTIACTVTLTESAGANPVEASDLVLDGTSHAATPWSVQLWQGTGIGPYSLLVSNYGAADGTLRVRLPAGATSDAAGNPSSASASRSWTIDRTRPTAGLSVTPAASLTRASAFEASATFSEPVTGFTASDVVLGGNGSVGSQTSVGSFAGTGATYTFVVTRTDPPDGPLTISIPADAAVDGAGNPSLASPTVARTIDRTPPTVEIQLDPPSVTPGSGTFVIGWAWDPNGVVSAEARLVDGPWTTMEAVDGAFGGPHEAARLPVVAPGTSGDYEVCVRATDAAGGTTSSLACATLAVRLPPTAPGAPTGVNAVAGVGSATVSWSPPADDGGSAITGYAVTSDPGSAGCATTARSCTVTGLTAGVAYTFVAKASNAAGVGPASAPSPPIIPTAAPTVPWAPADVTAVPGDGSALVSWSAPASDGGSAITGYGVTSNPDNRWCATTGALACTVTGLANGTAYSFTVIAQNVAGTSGASAPSTRVTPMAVVPVPPTATITPQPTWVSTPSVPLTWGATAGSSPVASYDIRYRRATWKGGFGSHVAWQSATTAAGAAFGAAAGSTYCFSALARDANGLASAWTAETCTAVPLDDRSLARSGRWSAGTGGSYYKGTYLRSSTTGAKLTRTSVVARRIAILATTCPTCGSVRVYWGSTRLRTISLRSTTTVNRKLITVTTFTSTRTGTLSIRVSSSGRKVIIDGVAIRRN